jgi:hypothetical protein
LKKKARREQLKFYPAYIQTCVEKDVRLMKNIGDLNAFIQFTRLYAGRIGHLKFWCSLAGLAEDQGVVVYGGDQSMQTSAGALISWRQLERVPG